MMQGTSQKVCGRAFEPSLMAVNDLTGEWGWILVNFSLNCVISFEVPENVLVERLKKRAIKEGRTDDTPEVLRNRLSPPHPPKRLALLKAISLNW